MKIFHVVIKKRPLIRFRIVPKGNIATLMESNNKNTTFSEDSVESGLNQNGVI